MKLYIDCTNGICTDMVRDALLDLGADREYLAAQTDCLAALSHHRTYQEIKEMLETSPLDPSVRKTALAVYRVMAEAESKVHGEPVERVHFHEVGRDEAIRNIVAVAAALENVEIGRAHV